MSSRRKRKEKSSSQETLRWLDKHGRVIRLISAKQSSLKKNKPSTTENSQMPRCSSPRQLMNLSQVSFDGTFDENDLVESFYFDSDEDSCDSVPDVLYLSPVAGF